MSLFKILCYRRITRYKYFYYSRLENALEDLKKAGRFCILLDPDLDPDVGIVIREKVEDSLALEALGFSKEETRWLLETSGFQAYRELERLKASREYRRQALANEIWNDTTLSTRERHMKIREMLRNV